MLVLNFMLLTKIYFCLSGTPVSNNFSDDQIVERLRVKIFF